MWWPRSEATTTLDVTGGVVTYTSTSGINNNLTVTRSGGNYIVNDPSTPIALSQNAVNAIWSVVDPNTVADQSRESPAALAVRLNDGADIISGIDSRRGQREPLQLWHDQRQRRRLEHVDDLPQRRNRPGDVRRRLVQRTDADTDDIQQHRSTSLQPIATQVSAIAASTGAGSMFITEADGTDVTASATSTGNVTIANLLGTLNVAGKISTVSGNISLSSADDITINTPM